MDVVHVRGLDMLTVADEEPRLSSPGLVPRVGLYCGANAEPR